ncbi:MAG: 5-methyltetrahydrofolate:corrinoid/iron-sulfur protein co-methyltransferase [Candidatus Moanabacter tarae]|uniref:5-methyltetrahydrofolate:corrinoid/iron-sulfur protein co-methyltransferase n=1 Tax=Candidatus Moanibacter tarae TaxID=2200854 RepID=A0A2Z4ACB5_9BACT|nr:MAG: 5-methyltetrahydrofolate:corrinoid/iron-sulfur protein co-methyltransferase [Candidatus Moanabacter tarae]
MKIKGLEREFFVIGENVHTTRILLRKGKRVTKNPEGLESVQYKDSDGIERFLIIPNEVKRTQDYEEGRIKHVKIAIQSAMGDPSPSAYEGMQYLRQMILKQVAKNVDFIDLNVDEISLNPAEQKTAMSWLVQTAQNISSVPLSIDSSNIETLEAGLAACRLNGIQHMLNSASLERIEVLDLAKRYNAAVIVSAAGSSGMPQNDDERVQNASRMVDTALDKEIQLKSIYIDPLIFPISVDSEFGNHAFEAIRRLREKYGPEIHITGGFSNVSFGIPCRRLVNNVFLNLVIQAGADSGIIDPITSRLDHVLSMERASIPYKLTENMLLGRDRFCKKFLRAYRKGELNG